MTTQVKMLSQSSLQASQVAEVEGKAEVEAEVEEEAKEEAEEPKKETPVTTTITTTTTKKGSGSVAISASKSRRKIPLSRGRVNSIIKLSHLPNTKEQVIVNLLSFFKFIHILTVFIGML